MFHLRLPFYFYCIAFVAVLLSCSDCLPCNNVVGKLLQITSKSSIRGLFYPSFRVEALTIEQPAVLSEIKIKTLRPYHEDTDISSVTSRPRRGVLQSISGNTLCEIFSSTSFDVSSGRGPNSLRRTQYNRVILLTHEKGSDKCSIVVKALVANLLGAEGLIAWIEGSSLQKLKLDVEPSLEPDIPIVKISKEEYTFLNRLVNDMQVELVVRVGEVMVSNIRFF